MIEPSALMEAVYVRTREYDYRSVNNGGDRSVVFCALCRCTKSGSSDTPNNYTDACEDLACPCHDGVEK